MFYNFQDITRSKSRNGRKPFITLFGHYLLTALVDLQSKYMKILKVPENEKKWYIMVRGQVTDYTIIRSKNSLWNFEEHISDVFSIFHFVFSKSTFEANILVNHHLSLHGWLAPPN